MGFPDGVLTADEEIVLHLHPHAKAAVRPVLVLVLAVAAITVAGVLLPANSGGRIGVLVVGVLGLGFGLTRGVWPLLVWRCTHYVFTNERVLLQDGVLTRRRRDLPLARVNDHAMSQGLLDRMLRCGTLTIDSLGERGPAVLVAVPGVERVQTTLYELIEQDRSRHDAADEGELAAPPPMQVDRSARRRVDG